MPTKLPADDRSSFLLCEDVRQEVGNKLSFMGVFTNDDIVVPKGSDAIVLASLVWVLLARGGNGPVVTQIVVVDPAGEKLFESPPSEAAMETGKSHIMLAKMVGPILKIGVYTAKFIFDGSTIERTFEIKEAG
jgi:hypothetical protein